MTWMRHRAIVRVTLAGSLLACLVACPVPEARAGRHALLVGVTEYPNLPQDSWLRGATNDTAMMAELLSSRFGFQDDQIVILAGWPKDPQLRPTRENIRKHLARLAKQARKGDQVVILFSGHGSQQPADSDPADMEPDGLDELFLPADTAKWDEEKKTVKNAIVDDDIKTWLTPIIDKGAFVWVLFDSCHSGTMTREVAISERQLRRVDPSLLIPKEVLPKSKSDKPGTIRSWSPRPGPSDSTDLPEGTSGWVAMYAAQSIEPTYELPLPSEDGPVHGIFTYTIAQVLSQAEGELTYRELGDIVSRIYRSVGLLQPIPLVEGVDLDRVVLEKKSWPGRPTLLLTGNTPAHGLELKGGSLAGLQAGTILEAFPPAGFKGSDESLGYLEVVTSRPLVSTVKPVAYEKTPAPDVDQLPEGTRCRIAFEVLGVRAMSLAVQESRPGSEGSFVLRAPGKATPVVEKALEKLGKDHPDLVQRTTRMGEADWFLRLQGGEAVLVPAAGWPERLGSPQGSGSLGDFVVGAIADEKGFYSSLRSALLRIARARRLLQIVANSQAVARGASGADIKIEVVRFPDPNVPKEVVVPFDKGGRTLYNGDTIAFRIKNSGRFAVDVTLLFVDSGYGITALFPEPGTVDDNRIPPGATIVTPQVEVTSDTIGAEQVVVIANRAGRDRQDFSCLEQASLERKRDAGTLTSPLGELLESAMFGDGAVRGLKRAQVDDCRMLLLPWYTVPEPRPAR